MEVSNAIRNRVIAIDSKFENQPFFLYANKTLLNKGSHDWILELPMSEVYKTYSDEEDHLLYLKYSNMDPYGYWLHHLINCISYFKKKTILLSEKLRLHQFDSPHHSTLLVGTAYWKILVLLTFFVSRMMFATRSCACSPPQMRSTFRLCLILHDFPSFWNRTRIRDSYSIWGACDLRLLRLGYIDRKC